MATEIRVPALGESVSEATVGQWFKKVGDAVKADEPLVELETDKVTVEVPAPASGILAEISVQKGTTVAVGTALGAIREGAVQAAAPAPAPRVVPPAAVVAAAPVHVVPAAAPALLVTAPVAQVPVVQAPFAPHSPAPAASGMVNGGGMPPSPAARKALAEAGVAAEDVAGSGKRGQVLKPDVAAAVTAAAAAPASVRPPVIAPPPAAATVSAPPGRYGCR